MVAGTAQRHVPNIRPAFPRTALHGQGPVRGTTLSRNPNVRPPNDRPTDETTRGAKAERTLYRPYGNWDTSLTWQSASAAPVDNRHGYIGARPKYRRRDKVGWAICPSWFR